MQTIAFKDKGTIKTVAHRGLSGLERENTCPAFVAAGVKSYYGIETDIHVTKDGKFIVFHDDDLKRIAGLDMVVEESTFEELRKVRFTDRDGITKREDMFLPSLEEYIAICRKYSKHSVLELKNRMEKEKIWEIAALIKDMGWFYDTTFISFSAENLLDLREKYPDADAAFLTGDSSDKTLRFLIENKIDADFWEGCITKEVVDTLHAAGRTVNCYTIDTLESANAMKEAGVDYITTDILE